MKLYIFHLEYANFVFAANNIPELVSLFNSHCGDIEQTDDDTENYDTETLLALVTALHNFDYTESETDLTDPQLVRSEYL